MRKLDTRRTYSDHYYNAVGNVQVDSYEKLSCDFADALRTGNEKVISAARQRVIEGNLRMVITMAKKYSYSFRLPLADLVAAGNEGLVVATQKFNPDRGALFTTYATLLIRSHILHYAIKEYNFRKRIQKPTVHEDGDTEDGVEQMPDGTPDGIEQALLNSMDYEVTHECVLQAMNALPPRERQVLELRFFQDPHMTLKEVGEFFGFTRERARQLEERALNRLRKRLKILDTNR